MNRVEKKVLLVDDMPTILKQGMDIIGERYIADTASSGREALEKVQSFKPDIVLLDMNMPEENGITIMEDIHSIPGFKDVPVIFTINDLTIMSTARAYDQGAADFLKKPFIPRNVYRKIDMHLKLAEIGWQFEL